MSTRDSIPTYSAIIAVRNAEDTLAQTLNSIKAASPVGRLEVILVDDGSDDRTPEIAEDYSRRCGGAVRVLRTETSRGPGAARNCGIREAVGDYLVFIDADDEVSPDYFHALDSAIRDSGHPEVVVYDFLTANSTHRSTETLRRRDAVYFSNRPRLVGAYLRNWMDGAAIFAAYRRDFLVDHQIEFRDGIHEDIDFMFDVYAKAATIEYLDAKIYIKIARPSSITSRISRNHLSGYLEAWHRIASRVQDGICGGETEWVTDLALGLQSAIASRVHEVIRRSTDLQQTVELLLQLHEESESRGLLQTAMSARPQRETTYVRLFEKWLCSISTTQTMESRVETLQELESILSRSWGCRDIAESLFLTPTEVRTCCQRYFIDGEMRGDVSLLTIDEEVANDDSAIDLGHIATAKRDLVRAINVGDMSPCDGCPSLIFREWKPLDRLWVNYLSMEHHSFCNLRCTYCDEEYFGGRRPKYSVVETVRELRDTQCLSPTATIVWGGGEPVLDAAFAQNVAVFLDATPSASHRFLTNSNRFSSHIGSLLESGHGQVITSLDAGSEATYLRVRGRAGLSKAISNLKRYAQIDPLGVIVKYIFTEQNGRLDDLRSFADAVAQAGLLECSFQISFDFKVEEANLSDLRQSLLLFSLLYEAGASHVFFDDLLYRRMRSYGSVDSATCDFLVSAGSSLEFLALASDIRSGVLWGTGIQAERMITQNRLLDSWDFTHAVDGQPAGGRHFQGLPMLSPEEVALHGGPILIAAVQATSAIRRTMRALAVPSQQLLRKLVM